MTANRLLTLTRLGGRRRHGFCGAGDRLACPGAVALRPGAEVGLVDGEGDGDGAAVETGAGAGTGTCTCGALVLGAGTDGLWLVGGSVGRARACAAGRFCEAIASGSNGPMMFGAPRNALPTRPI